MGALGTVLILVILMVTFLAIYVVGNALDNERKNKAMNKVSALAEGVTLPGSPGDEDYEWVKRQYQLAGVKVFNNAPKMNPPKRTPSGHQGWGGGFTPIVPPEFLEARKEHYKKTKRVRMLTEREQQAESTINRLARLQERKRLDSELEELRQLGSAVNETRDKVNTLRAEIHYAESMLRL